MTYRNSYNSMVRVMTLITSSTDGDITVYSKDPTNVVDIVCYILKCIMYVRVSIRVKA